MSYWTVGQTWKQSIRVDQQYYIWQFQEHVALVQQLLKKGAQIEAEDMDGLTALHLAAGLGNEVLLQLFLDHNADINKKSSQ